MSKYSLITLNEVHSTNSYALENISFLEDKSVVCAVKQTQGRGRYNRHWVCDDSDNIFASLVLKPQNIKNYPFSNLTQYLSVVICKFLESQFGLNPQIKWPNDILIDGAKISGILAETYMQNNEIKAIVLGLGLNVNMTLDTLNNIDQKAVSLSVLTGKTYNSESVLRNLLDLFFLHYEDFELDGFGFIKNDYIARCGFLGKNITISENGQKKPYFAKAIDDNGLLVAIDENNCECKIITGDVLC